MTFLQKLLTRLLPTDLSAAMKAESQSWILRCATCGMARSLWDAGGVRYKGTSHAKRTIVWCPQCRRLRVTDLTCE
jgi:hypothetical protein